MTRFPFLPLETIIVDRRLERAGQVAALATRLGVHTDLIHRYRREGLRTDTADRLATKVGLHPRCVWDTWDEGVEDGVCECGELVPFISRSPLCVSCTNKETRRVRDKERRERDRERRLNAEQRPATVYVCGTELAYHAHRRAGQMTS